jgi:N-acetylglutamate synthase-like GNAT family acetyltransferase
MYKLRKALPPDREAIIQLLTEAELHYPGETFEEFLLVERDGKAAGVMRLEEYGDFIFLTSLGVAKAERGKGAASFLLNSLLPKLKKKVYLYTVIPEFFLKFKFVVTRDLPSHLPPKEIYGCSDCYPGKCVCMVKYPA